MLEAKQTCSGFEVSARMVVCFNDVFSAATTELVYVIALVVDHDAGIVIATSGYRFFHCVIRAKFLATRSVVHLEEVIEIVLIV